MRRVIGAALVALVLGGIFVATALTSSWLEAAIEWSSAVGLALVLFVGLNLMMGKAEHS